MKLSAVQTKTFLRLQRKHNVSTAFILQNMPAILKFVQFAITPHIVLKQKLIRRRNRVFLRYNHLRKLIFDPSQLKKRQRAKRIHSQWSKRMVVHLRHFKTVEFVEEESSCDAVLPEEDVSKQLKEQLELLKSGKRTIPLLEEPYAEQRQSATVSIEETSDNEDAETGMETETTITEDTQLDVLSDRPGTPLLTALDQVEDVDRFASQNKRTTRERLPIVSDRRSGNFLDMLISKVKSTSDEPTAISDSSMEPPKKYIKAATSREVVESSVDERENSNSSSDFFGFDDNERILGTSPGMLSTPLVQNRDLNSAFESETLNAYMRDNSLESSTTMKFPLRRSGDGLVFANSIPPKLDMPALPEGLQGLRTVAERRSFLQRTRNVKYCIINNVNTIYHELQKRTKGHRINKHSIESLQSSTVPLTRQGWKAATWLLTDVGNYFYQTINIDGENYRLYGCRGNSPRKYIRPHSSRCTKILSVCPEECIDRITFRLFRPIRTLERRSKLGDASLKITYKACPLSQKIAQQVQEDEAVYDSLEIVQLPQVEMEVFPHLQKPLHDIAKRYLQLILPFNGISREWAEFSVSTLIDRKQMKVNKNSHPSFTFKLPYRNDRSHMLVQRIHSRSEAFEGQLENSQLSFRKEIDQKKADGEAPDLLAEECADILSDMLNSVAISSSENSFLKDDPDNIYQKSVDDYFIAEKSVKKVPELHQQHVGPQNRKQSRLLMELRRLNATIIDAAASKTDEDGATCDKGCCRLGCVCASINEGFVVRQHCGKQRCILDCNCKCPTVMRLETDGRTITTEDAFMLRRQATAKLARVEKEFTSTIVLTGSETLLINESQYDKKRRCTKIPKRYGEFIDPDESDVNDSKAAKKVETSTGLNFPLEPILVKDKIYQRLKHCSVNVKRMRDVNELVPWCMVHMVYKCYCKGSVTVGNPIVVEKQEEQQPGGTTIEEVAPPKPRTLYSFEKEESKANDATSSCYESDTSVSNSSDLSYIQTSTKAKPRLQSGQPEKLETRGRKPDVDCIGIYMNSKANHCRRVVAIPKNTYQRKNKKRLAEVHLFIAENETEETRLSLNEHVLRSVYYHRHKRSQQVPVKVEQKAKVEDQPNKSAPTSVSSTDKSPIALSEKRKLNEDKNVQEDSGRDQKRSRLTSASSIEEGTSLLRVNRYKDSKKEEVPPDYSQSESPIAGTSTYTPQPYEQITVPKISQIFSLNTQAMEVDTETGAAVSAYIPEQSSDAATCAEGVSSDAFKSVFNVVIKNMNNLVSKKMQDIDMALRRESKAIPAPNDEILCIIRWNNFLEAFMSGFVYLWEVRTINMTFIAATIKNMMPLVVNALSVVNIRALPKDGLPLLGRMLMDRLTNSVTDGLAVVMQGQKMYWFVKGFLRPDKTRICPKPTPQTHPLLTKKINILCRLLINQQMNELKRRQERLSPELIPQPNATIPQIYDIDYLKQNQQLSSTSPSQSPRPPSSQALPPPPPAAPAISLPPPQPSNVVKNVSLPKVKVLPMQRNISDHATSILEQMVTQAYGMVRSNISSRKLRQSELKEIYMPATIREDHQWLVLDISSDFSHIFIPELRDLLTLDRVQKVMAYAITKSRIVKMQFCQKPLFNAYVTPMSNRKLYFGPFRNTFQTPQLILLQSVDGQMMLREVYESRHHVALKTEKTCSFWLTQRQGKLFLDVEQETTQEAPPNDDGLVQVQQEPPIQEIVDDDDIWIVQNVNSGIDAITDKVQDEVVKNVGVPPVEEPKQSMQGNKPDEEDDDDDCMIIDVDPNENAVVDLETLVSAAPIETVIKPPERINYTISYTGENSSLVVTQNECEYVENAAHSFTILKPENEPKPIMHTLGLEQSEANNMQQQLPQELLNVNIEFDPMDVSAPSFVKAVSYKQPIVNAVATLPKPLSLPKMTTIKKKTPIYVKRIMPPESTTITPPGVESDKMESTVVTSQASKDNSQQNVQSIQVQPSGLESNVQKLTSNAIKWNNNVTITKLAVDGTSPQCSTPADVSNSQAILSTIARKSLTVMSSSKGKIMIQKPNGRFSLPSVVQPEQKQPTKPKVITAQEIRQHLMNKTAQPILQQPSKATTAQAPPNQMSIKQPVVKKVVPPTVFHPRYTSAAVRPMMTPRPTLNPRIVTPGPIVTPRPVFTPRPAVTPHSALPPLGGVSIRSPAAINTLVKRQQQQLTQQRSPTTTTAITTATAVVTTNTTSNAAITNTTSTSVTTNATTTLAGGSLAKVINPAARLRAQSTISSMPRMQPNPITNTSHAVFLKNPANMAASSSNTKNPTVSQQVGQLRRIMTKTLSPAAGGPPNKIQKLSTGEQAPTAGKNDSPQSDPLHIPEELPVTAVEDLPQTKLPKDLTAIRIAAAPTQTKAVNSTDASCGIKRNSIGNILNRPSTQSLPTKLPVATAKSNPNTIVTSVANSLEPQVKGIPVDLPRLKKFAIIGSANTTVITPLGPQSVETKVQNEGDGGGSSSITDSSVQKKKIIVGTASITCPPAPSIITKNVVKATSSSSSPSTVTLNPTIKQKNGRTEYGYFFANMEGLPKFVVKHVDDDFLIKVPNFHGILKLSGLTTVHNYLNQYTIQKCGKTAEDIANLKWIFKPQDRSKLNSISRSNSNLSKPTTPVVQRVMNLFNRSPSTPTSASPSTTSPTKAGPKPIASAPIKIPDAKSPIVLVDDE